MTKNQVNDLTPEEQAEIESKMPMMLTGITEGNPVAIAWLAHWRSKRSIGEEATAQAEEIKQEVVAASQEPEQASLAQWCGFPTDMTRCSPFFPMNPNELGERRYLENYLITSANWGEIRYTGPKLSTYEEDALLALLAILDKESKYRKISYACEVSEEYNCMGGYDSKLLVYGDYGKDFADKTYTYKGPMLPLFKLLGIERPGKTNYTRLLLAFERLTVAGVKISISAGKTKSGKKRAPKKSHMCAMLGAVYWNDEKKELTATINPFFYEAYVAGHVTFMDVAKRMSLKGVISKALYRFVQSQRQNPVFIGHFLTLADALNMDREQLSKQLRRQLKTAIGELIRQGILMKKSGFVDTDIIRLERAPEALPPQEKRKLGNR